MSNVSDRLLQFYRDRIERLGVGYEAMWGDSAGWKSAERFAPLLSLPIAPGDTVVDIGCGTAELAAFLKRNNLDIEYVGVEAVPEFATHARETHHVRILEIDAFRNLDRLPDADWFVTFGTLNKSWSVADLPGTADPERIHSLIEQLLAKARKGVAVSLVTDVVDYRKDGVVNISPAATAQRLARLSPHFTIYHGYPFFEFFAAAWKGVRR